MKHPRFDVPRTSFASVLMGALLLVGGCAQDEEPTLDDELRPSSGSVVIDLTDEEQAEWFMASSRPFYWLDDANAGDLVRMEYRGDSGVCVGISSEHRGYEEADFQPFFENFDDYYGRGEPIPPREPSPETEGKCDGCSGITIPYFTPRSMSVTMSSINVDEVNRPELFTNDPDFQSELALSTPFHRGFVGLMMRIPARSEGSNVVAEVTPQTRYEVVYLRPSNGDATPGPFDSGNPATTVQFAVTFWEWFVLRTRAFRADTDAEGNPVSTPVFEGPASTVFGDTDLATLATDTNVMSIDFDDGPALQLRVNGAPVTSNVTGEPFDRTLGGSYVPNDSAETMSAFLVEPGVYACMQSIELEL